jgi:hypothetical protein
MSANAEDLPELRRNEPASAELRRLAASIIAVGVADQLAGC